MAQTKSIRRARAAGRSERLTRDEIVAAAMSCVERGELERLTMRGLAAQLGVTAMSLYAHIAGKDDLLDEVLDRLLADRATPLPGAGGWREWMLDAAGRLRQLFIDQPALLDRYRRRPVGVHAALVRMEAGLRVLRDAGFGDRDAVALFASVHTYTIGFVSLELSRGHSSQEFVDATRDDESSPGFWPQRLLALDRDEFPILQSVRPDLAAFTSAAYFRRGLDAILDGFTNAPSR